MGKENYGKPYRTILMGDCECSKYPTEQKYVRNEGDIDIRQCLECDKENQWDALIITPASQSQPGTIQPH